MSDNNKISEGNYEPEASNTNEASVASHSSGVGNSIEQILKTKLERAYNTILDFKVFADWYHRHCLKLYEENERLKSLLNRTPNVQASVATDDASSNTAGQQNNSLLTDWKKELRSRFIKECLVSDSIDGLKIRTDYDPYSLLQWFQSFFLPIIEQQRKEIERLQSLINK